MKIIIELTTEELHERILHATTELIEREVAKKFEADMDAVAKVTASVDETKTKLNTVKRYAEVGERILIVHAQQNHEDYSNGDIFKVIKLLDSLWVPNGSVYVEDIPRHIWPGEYEVIIEEDEIIEQDVPLTANQQRAELNQRAREFVEVKIESLKDSSQINGGYKFKKRENPNYCSYVTKVNFIVNSEKRTVVALLSYMYGKELLGKGIAKSMPGDVFNADIGKAIALARALEIDIPQEFTDAVQPDEVVEGMVIKYGQGEPLKVMESLEIEHSPREYTHLTTARDSPRTQIIDDTIAEYEIYE